MPKVILGPKGHPPSYIMKSFRRFDRFVKKWKEEAEENRRNAFRNSTRSTGSIHTSSTGSTGSTGSTISPGSTYLPTTFSRSFWTTTTSTYATTTSTDTTNTFTQDFSFEQEERLGREHEKQLIRARAAWAKKQKIRRIRMKRRRIENE